MLGRVATAPTAHSSWIDPGRVLVGSYPADLEPLVGAGATLFVDLTEEGEQTSYAHRLPARVGHRRLAVPDFACPSEAEMRETLDAIDAELDRGGVVFLHCLGGCGRTGTVAGCWLVRHGLSGEQALARLGGSCPETAEQRQLVLDWPTGT
jgi:hypothetical protein